MEEYKTSFHMQSILLEHFRYSTCEFVWDEFNSLSRNIFAQCIIFQCIILNFDLLKIEKFGKIHFEKSRDREKNLSYILQTNARTIFGQKFSTRDLLLISDSTFPPTSSFWGDHILQTSIKSDREIIAPITIPTVILVRSSNSFNLTVYSHFTAVILIFISSDGSDVKIGCFSCDFRPSNGTEAYTLTFENAPLKDISCFNDLYKFWEKLHLFSIRSSEISPALNIDNCLKISNYKLNVSSNAKSCEILETFVRIKNCTLELCTTSLFQIWLKPPIRFNYFVNVFPFGQQQIDFSFQLHLPKIHFFDANLTAFLLPFTITIWLCIGITILATSAFLIYTETKSSGQVIFWQCEVLLVQGGELLRWIRGKWGKITITTWIFTTLFLRQFYNSSLYSFMAKEKESNDFPKSMEELLVRKDIPLLSPASFLSELSWIYARETDRGLALRLIKFYMKILPKSSFILGNHEMYIRALQQASNGSLVRSIKINFRAPRNQAKNRLSTPRIERSIKETRFNQFAVMCVGDCEMSLKGVFLGKTRLNNQIIVPKQRPFFRVFQFWHAFPNFATVSFSNFLAYFVQSGLHDLAIGRYKMLKQLKLLESLNYGRKLGMSNGSLFSYIFLSKKDEKVFNSSLTEHASAKVSEFVGTFILTGFMFGLSLVILIFEVGKSMFKDSKYNKK
ncbi:unnamed protein product [Orchesella dallaii]|uniref:Uncharacterized protein n=1 Tax=Orchesella dallaii TaxID=48710 RepID=A0ABP1Q792_9HEXA